MYFSTILKVLKMIYQLFWFLTTCFTFLFNALWLCCNFASVGIPWLMLLFFLVCIASKFVKLKCPASEIVQSMLHRSEKGVDSEVLYWPIVSRGGAFDAPENSLAAINHCLSQKCYNILLDLTITSDGHLVMLNRTTLEKANINEPIHKLKLSSLENFNISEHHPLGQHFQSEKIITFERLLKLLETNELTVFLLASHTNAKLIELVREAVDKNSLFAKRIIFCCSSPIAIYQQHLLATWNYLRTIQGVSTTPEYATPSTSSGTSNLSRVEKLLAASRKSKPTNTNDMEKRIRRIPLELYLPLNSEVISFWEKKKREDKELADLALTALSVPCTQVSVERCFNGLGQILTKPRMKLGAVPLELILFAKANNAILESVYFQYELKAEAKTVNN